MRTLASLALVLLVASAAAPAEAQRRRRGAEGGEGTLVIQCPQADAEVLIDEEPAGFTPLDPLRLSPGSHTVRVRRPGYTELSEVVVIRTGQSVTLPADLIALSMVVTVRSQPEEARVFVGGAFRGTTPLELELVEGEHSIRVAHPGHREVIRSITAVAGQTSRLDLELEALPASDLEPRPIEWFEEPAVWLGVGGGVAAVAVVVALAVVLGGQGGGSQLQDFCSLESDCVYVQPIDWRW